MTREKIVALGFLLTCFSIQGCTGHLYHTINPYIQEGTTKSTYKIGEEQESSIGSTMILIANFRTITTQRLAYRSKYALPPDANGFEINPSQIWIAWGKRDDGIIKILVTGSNPHLSIDILEDGSIPDETMKEWKLKDRKLPDRKLFEKTTAVSEAVRMLGFKGELIYNGISKNTIKITYREFINELARPAFYQELNYDLDQSDLIQFKSLKIKVLRADNSRIKFIILDDGGLPWMPKE